MELNFGLHLKIEFTNISEFHDNIEKISKQTSKYIWLSGIPKTIKPYIAEINEIIAKTSIQVITELEDLIDDGLNIHGLICDNYKSIGDKKAKYAELIIGGLATDVVDAKNVELYGGAFVYLGPVDKIGKMPYVTLIPKEPDYEWRFLDITIPIISYGELKSKALLNLCEIVNLSGFACSIKNIDTVSKSTYRFVAI